MYVHPPNMQGKKKRRKIDLFLTPHSYHYVADDDEDEDESMYLYI
jgi:hypothetical protein